MARVLSRESIISNIWSRCKYTESLCCWFSSFFVIIGKIFVIIMHMIYQMQIPWDHSTPTLCRQVVLMDYLLAIQFDYKDEVTGNLLISKKIFLYIGLYFCYNWSIFTQNLFSTCCIPTKQKWVCLPVPWRWQIHFLTTLLVLCTYISLNNWYWLPSISHWE